MKSPEPATTDSLALSQMLSPDLAAAIADKPTDRTNSTETVAIQPPPFPTPPPEPETLAEAGLTEGVVDALLLKALLGLTSATGAQLAGQVGLPNKVVGECLARYREELLVTIKGSSGPGDYIYLLTEAGHLRARQHAEHGGYAAWAPVPLHVYDQAIRRQAISTTKFSTKDLCRALGELTLSDPLLSRTAQALADGRGLFLYGSPGNGKTTLAESLCAAFGEYLWIPRALSVGTDIVRLFDATCHEPIEAPELAHLRYDRRWILIRRPTVVVGGELTLDQLEPSYHAPSGVSEAPVQLKANGGVLVIDDFGRQCPSSTEILNRLIVPLEKQHDYLSLASGCQAQVPFELLFVLSTNLEPRDLVDEAFLRRIPYKIEVEDPTVEQFHALFESCAQQLGVLIPPGAVEWLLKKHYEPVGRPMRFCHPRDLLRQARNFCVVHERPLAADQASLTAAVQNYFAGL